MQKIRYEVDPHNRLIINRAGGKSSLRKFRKVLDGHFSVDGKGALAYHVKTPLSGDRRIPNQIRLKGEWSLTEDHNLRLAVDKSERDTFGEQITLEGEILDVNENSLLFAVTTTKKDGAQSTYVLNLGGVWKADDRNRLSFYVKKEEGRYDILTFKGAWEIDKDHQIIYRYEKAALVRKKKEVHTLTFQGHWDIKERFRISYVLSRDTGSAFDFETGLGILKEDRIEYALGIGLSGAARPKRRKIVLFGRWMLKRDVGLVFEMGREYGRREALVFGADVRLSDKDTVLFRLRNDVENKNIGLSLELSHKILKGDGEAFLNLLRSGRESAIYAGAAWRW